MLATLLGFLLASAPIDTPAPAPREFRGVWVATVDRIDWPPKDVNDPEKQRKRLVAILDKAKQLRLNAVILQVRPMSDAFYAHSIEPWSEFLTGVQGRAPNPYWDPLEFAVFEAHARGLELHAWFNPYRVWHPAAKGKPAAGFIGALHPDWVKQYGKFLWLDPGERGVQEHVLQVILDVVRRYDVDGIHLDDYFYPYPITQNRAEVPFPDDSSWRRYLSSGGTLSRGDWRRNNVNEFVAELYKRVKNAKPWVKVGISPFGIYRPGVPASIKAGVDQYNGLYADPVKWLANGWCDYLSPQLYWRIKQTAQSFPVLAQWWSQQNPRHRHIWPGLFASQVGTWSPEEIIDQVKITRNTAGEDGEVFYSMAPFMKDSKGVNEKLSSSLFTSPALVPASPWLKGSIPSAPKLEARRISEGRLISMTRESNDSYQWAIYVKSSDGWHFQKTVPAQQGKVLLNGSFSAVAVSALDRYGNESQRTVLPLR